MDNTYSIFGKSIRIISQDSNVSDTLTKEFSIYPPSDSAKCDIVIEHVKDLSLSKAISTNPSQHSLIKNGFVAALRPLLCEFTFESGKIKSIKFSIQPAGRLMTLLRKWANIQFTTHKEGIGQWIHEHILIPLIIVDNDLAVIHASAVKTIGGQTLVFGGTGGVGKTSLEISLCRNEGCSFIADDICALDNEGNIYPNLAYPKVYAYNIDGKSDIRQLIFKGRSILDKLQFNLHELRGKKFARRRISPADFYGSISSTRQPLSSFFILFRDNSKEIIFEKIENNQASSLNSLVISREFGSFFDHLVWNEYNVSGSKEISSLKLAEILSRSEEVMNQGLSKPNNSWIVRIPHDMPHSDYQNQMVEKLKNLGFLD